MFKLVVLSALLAIAAARPSHIEAPVVYSAPAVAVEEHGYANVGAVVKSVPTAVSHQSQSVVHSSAHVVEPVVAPVVKTTYAAPVAPVVKTVAAAPLVHTTYAAAAPLVKTVAPVVQTYAAAPIVKTIGTPLVHTTYGAHVAVASPLTYTATGVW